MIIFKQNFKTGGVKMPGKKEEQGQYCQCCGRKFYPKTGSKICKLCQQGIIAKKVIPDPKAKRNNKKDKKVCLRCDQEFNSDGIYNRICPNCSKRQDNHEPNQGKDFTETETLLMRWRS